MLPLFPSASRGNRPRALLPGLVNKVWAPTSTAPTPGASAKPGGPCRAVMPPHEAHH